MSTADTAIRDAHRLFRAALLALAYPGWPVPVTGRTDHEIAHALIEAGWPAGTNVSTEPENADVLLIDGPTSDGRLRKAPRGTEELPEDGATAIYVVDRSPATQVRLSGPGIDGVNTVAFPLTARELADRATCCAQKPVGVDLLVITGGTIIGLPRSTRVEVIG
jgi:alpha-D-ribose 1-methylphosphonate 5-triphosphate synthase subunit PhnH